MTKLPPKQRKDFAKNLYLNEKGITQKEIAIRADVTEATVSKWIKEERWDMQRKSLFVTRDEQLAIMYNQLAAMNNAINERDEGKRFPNSKEADAILKISSAINKMENDTGVAQKLSACKEFLIWLRSADAKKAMEFLPLFDAFIKDVLR